MRSNAGSTLVGHQREGAAARVAEPPAAPATAAAPPWSDGPSQGEGTTRGLHAPTRECPGRHRRSAMGRASRLRLQQKKPSLYFNSESRSLARRGAEELRARRFQGEVSQRARGANHPRAPRGAGLRVLRAADTQSREAVTENVGRPPRASSLPKCWNIPRSRRRWRSSAARCAKCVRAGDRGKEPTMPNGMADI